MKWFDVHVGGQKWRVEIVRSNSPHLRHEDGDHTMGMTVYDKCRIYIDRDQDEQAREDTLLHELLHATFEVAGVRILLNPELEERIIRALVPILHRLLKDLGFRFPKGPEAKQ